MSACVVYCFAFSDLWALLSLPPLLLLLFHRCQRCWDRAHSAGLLLLSSVALEGARQCCHPTPSLSTSSRSPWHTESHPWRPSSSSRRWSPASRLSSSSLTQGRQTGSGQRPSASVAPVSALEAPPLETRTVGQQQQKN